MLRQPVNEPGKKAKGGRTEEEEEEGLVVGVPHAIVDPGAVVVHAQHAPLAHPAVVRPGRLGLPALLAEPHQAALRHSAGGLVMHLGWLCCAGHVLWGQVFAGLVTGQIVVQQAVMAGVPSRVDCRCVLQILCRLTRSGRDAGGERGIKYLG